MKDIQCDLLILKLNKLKQKKRQRAVDLHMSHVICASENNDIYLQYLRTIFYTCTGVRKGSRAPLRFSPPTAQPMTRRRTFGDWSTTKTMIIGTVGRLHLLKLMKFFNKMDIYCISHLVNQSVICDLSKGRLGACDT